MSGWQEFVNVVLILVVLVWCIAAVPLGRAWMRSDLLKDGYRVSDTDEKGDGKIDLATGDGRWVIEVWQDGWVKVQR